MASPRLYYMTRDVLTQWGYGVFVDHIIEPKPACLESPWCIFLERFRAHARECLDGRLRGESRHHGFLTRSARVLLVLLRRGEERLEANEATLLELWPRRL